MLPNLLFLFVFEVLQLLKSAQMQHGLRHGDYTRYRFVLMRFVSSFDLISCFQLLFWILLHWVVFLTVGGFDFSDAQEVLHSSSEEAL